MRLPLILAAVAACGGSPKPPPTAPLPDDSRQASRSPVAAPGARSDARSDAKGVAKPEPGAGDNPGDSALPRTDGTDPVELKIPPAQTAVKVVSDGKGKKQALRYTARPGAKQGVEIALDFAGKQDTDESIVPTIVLIGEAETKTVDKDGGAEFTLTVTGTDVRAVPGSAMPVDQFKTVLGSLAGLTFGGKRDANGNAGEVTMRIEHPSAQGADTLELIRVTFPVLPILPAQPVGVGARWQATTAARLADKLEVTQVTDYELVAHDGQTWKIKGTTRITGKDQEVENAKISSITGTGTSETTIAEGVLYPAHKASLETQFKASDPDKSSQFVLRLGSAFTPR